MLLHIGYHKTGTKTLQSHVFIPEKGFCSPWHVHSGEAVEHFVLEHPRKFSPAAVRARFLAAVEAAGGQGLVPIITHEDLSGNPMSGRYYGFQVVEHLHAAFPDARLMMGIREQKSMLRSLYGQYIVQEGMWHLHHFLGDGKERRGFKPICRLDHLEYDLMVERCYQLFGQERVLVLPFELLRSNPRQFEQQILDFAGTGKRVENALPSENTGLGATTLGVHRWLNQYARRPPIPPSSEYERWPLAFRAKKRVCKVLQRIIPRHWHQARDRRLQRQIAERVGSYYGDSNTRLAAMTGLDLEALGYDLTPTDSVLAPQDSVLAIPTANVAGAS